MISRLYWGSRIYFRTLKTLFAGRFVLLFRKINTICKSLIKAIGLVMTHKHKYLENGIYIEAKLELKSKQKSFQVFSKIFH